MTDATGPGLIPASETPSVITDDIALNMAAGVLDTMGRGEVAAVLRLLLPEAEGRVYGEPYQEQVGKWGPVPARPARLAREPHRLPVDMQVKDGRVKFIIDWPGLEAPDGFYEGVLAEVIDGDAGDAGADGGREDRPGASPDSSPGHRGGPGR